MKLVFLVFFSLCVIKAEIYPILELDDGKIQGISQITTSGKLFYAFKEIPYAKPPIGELRFTEPTPPEKWEGVRDTTKNTKICMQKILFPIGDIPPDPRENEDCLYLNVFTPILYSDDSELLPVYVYIYGGMHVSGDPTEYSFQDFIDEDIIVVTMSFRSSSLGFLCTDDGVIPGNLAIKDQIQAFKWVKNNIKHFGGDPKKVTIGGHSSGGENVGFHLLNTKFTGFFRAAIIQSSSPLMSVTRTLNATETAYSFAETFDPAARSKSTHELLQFLRSLPPDVIARSNFKKRPSFLYSRVLPKRPTWGPTYENSSFENSVVSGPSHEHFENGIFHHVPILMGMTSEELLNMDVVSEHKKLDGNLTRLLDPSVNIRLENKAKVLLEIKKIYTNTTTLLQNVTALMQLHSDLCFCMPILYQAYLQSKFSNVYFYQFSYKGPINGLEKFKTSRYYQLEGLGQAEHCSELPLLYNYRLNPNVTPSEKDMIVRKRMIKLWTNFIKYLNPTPVRDALLQETIWPKMTQTDLKYIDISTNLSIKTNPRKFVEWYNKLEKYFEYPRYVY